MQVSLTFLKGRVWVFSSIIFVSLIWTAALSIEAFTRWSLSGQPERSFLVVLLLINLITVIMLPVLLILRFRPWLDGARMCLLLFAHIGTAAGYSSYFSKLQCVTLNEGDGAGVCALVNIYTLIGCWINPIMLIIYTVCLLILIYRTQNLVAVDPHDISSKDLEVLRTRGSALPIMHPDEERRGSATTMQAFRPPSSERSSSQQTLDSVMKDDKSQWTRSARLLKPLPAPYF